MKDAAFMTMSNAARHDFTCPWGHPGVLNASAKPCTCGLADDIAAIERAARMDVCNYPEDPEDGSVPQGFDEWADPSGLCEHEHCAEGNRIGRLFRQSKGDHMTADDIEALRADRELIADEYHGKWVMDHGGYVVVAEGMD